MYDGDSNAAEEIGKFCGNAIPTSHISSSNKVFMQFKSYSFVSHRGFKLEYHPYSKTLKHE